MPSLAQVMKAAREARRGPLQPKLEETRSIIKKLKKDCFARMQHHEVREELLHKFGQNAGQVGLVMKELQAEKTNGFIAPVDEPRCLAENRTMYILLIHRSEASVKAFRKLQAKRQVAQSQLAQTEALYVFVLEEQRFLQLYLKDPRKWDLNKFNLPIHLSSRSGFIRSELASDHGSYMYSEYLKEQFRLLLEKCEVHLEETHKIMWQVLDALPHAAASVIQSFWRDILQRVKVRNIQERWKRRHRRWKHSKEVWPGRKSMIKEDRLSRQFRDMTKAACLVQRLFRQVRAEKISAELAGMGLMERRRIEREKREDEEFKRRFKAQLESEAKLRAWKCHICEKKRYPHPNLPYKSWKAVEEHLAGHKMLQDMKEERKRKRQAQFQYRLDKEQTHVRQVRRQRILRERGRYAFALVLSDITQHTVLFRSQLDKIMRARKRERALQALRIQAAEVALEQENQAEDQEEKGEKDTPSRRCDEQKRCTLDAASIGEEEIMYLDPIFLRDGINKVGRSQKIADHTIDLSGNLVSRLHFSIQVSRTVLSENDGKRRHAPPEEVVLSATITDCSSRNGTMLKNIQLEPNAAYKIEPGDVIIVGNCPDNPRLESQLKFALVRIDTFN